MIWPRLPCWCGMRGTVGVVRQVTRRPQAVALAFLTVLTGNLGPLWAGDRTATKTRTRAISPWFQQRSGGQGAVDLRTLGTWISCRKRSPSRATRSSRRPPSPPPPSRHYSPPRPRKSASAHLWKNLRLQSQPRSSRIKSTRRMPRRSHPNPLPPRPTPSARPPRRRSSLAPYSSATSPSTPSQRPSRSTFRRTARSKASASARRPQPTRKCRSARR